MSCRHLSTLPLDADVLDELCRQQRDTLLHLHASIEDPLMLARFDNLQTIDVWQARREDEAFVSVQIDDQVRYLGTLTQQRSAKRIFGGGNMCDLLAFIQNDPNTAPISDVRAHGEDAARFRALEELALYDMLSIMPVLPSFLHAVPVDRLSSLTIWRCQDAHKSSRA
jgi:hypothetical protein